METTRTCPQCRQLLSADAPDGLCPQCLMKAAAGPPPNATAAGLPGDMIDIGDPAEVAKKLPQFEILELLGRGGMGVVYKARQIQLDRLVALKILPPVDALSPDFVARFTREAHALAKLNHPNIVSVHDFGETGGLYYIVMEYVDGANLREVFQSRRLIPVEALAIVPRICDALQYAHEEGLVHRDIKPENLLIDKKGRVKIADFGLAKLLRRDALDITLTTSGMALGTLRYMAPEQLDKPEAVDHRADLYSLGVVIYEMLTGETPVGRFQLPSEKAQVDARLDEIVLHALEREPARRYQQASEVRDDVEKVTDTTRAQAPTTRPARPSNDAAEVEEDGEMESSIGGWGGRIIALAAVILAFFNPWGVKAWYVFAAGCAIFGVLMSFGIGWRAGRRQSVASGAAASRDSSREPRLSKFALAGAGLAFLGLVAMAAGLFLLRLNAVEADISQNTGAVHVPPNVVLIPMFAVFVSGVGSMIGTSIFGAVAVRHIRDSNGALYGLPLAVADVLFFPLLILWAVVAVMSGLLFAFTTRLPVAYIEVPIIGALPAFVVCFFIARAAWRKMAVPAR